MNLYEALIILRNAAVDYAEYLSEHDEEFESDEYASRVNQIDDALDVWQKYRFAMDALFK